MCEVPQESPAAAVPEPSESLSLISHSASASDADDLLNVSVRDIVSTPEPVFTLVQIIVVRPALVYLKWSQYFS